MVAPCLVAFPEYRPALQAALLERKLRHWDRDLRALAAAALGALVPTDLSWAEHSALPQLRALCLDPVLEVRWQAGLPLQLDQRLGYESGCWQWLCERKWYQSGQVSVFAYHVTQALAVAALAQSRWKQQGRLCEPLQS